MTGVRFRETGWEGRCDVCRTWLPLDDSADGWEPYSGYRRCSACRALWQRHLYRTGERLTEVQLIVEARRERHRVENHCRVRQEPRALAAARARRYRARRRESERAA